MKVFFEQGTFKAACTFEQRLIFKNSGFTWNASEKRWTTKSCRVASIIYAEYPNVFDSCALEAIESMKEAIAESRSLSPRSISVPAPKGLTYLPYQQAGVELMIERPACLLADEAGTGKTIQIAGLINATKPSKVLIICPASLRLNWRNELQRWLINKYEISFEPDKGDIVIVSYDSTWRKGFISELIKRKFDLFVADEAHYVKNEVSKRTKATLCLAQRCKRKVYMTGTPILNRPIEMFSFLNNLRPDLFPDKMAYASRYCGLYLQNIPFSKYDRTLRRKVVVIKKVWNMSGASNLEELQDLLRSHLMVRRLKADVLPQLPKKIRQIIELPCEDRQTSTCVKNEYKKWEEISKKYGFEKAAEMLSSGMAQITFKDFAKDRRQVAMSKSKMAIEHITDMLESVDKLVVFAHHKDVVEELYKGLSDFNPVKFVGGMSDEDKSLSVSKFQTDTNVRVFIGNIQAAGVGITLTAASNIVFVELPLDPGHMTQAEDRCVRIGAEADSVLIQYLVFENSLDALLCRMPIEKQRVADKALDI